MSEDRAKVATEQCADCGHERSDPRFHFEAPGTNWGAALHSFRTKIDDDSVRSHFPEERAKPEPHRHNEPAKPAEDEVIAVAQEISDYCGDKRWPNVRGHKLECPHGYYYKVKGELVERLRSALENRKAGGR